MKHHVGFLAAAFALTLALGQSSGAPMFAALLEKTGTSIALAVFSGVALIASFIRPRQVPAKLAGRDAVPARSGPG